MGKKSNLKKILRVCKNLPAIEKIIHEYHIVDGKKLIEEYGTNTMPNGDVINPEKTYRVAMPVISEISHKQNLKRLYKKYGSNSAFVYIDAIIDHVKNNP